MRISHFFIDRPIFAAVVSIVITILGAVSFSRLPVAQYPEIAPPIITVTGQYPGASAETVASTVVAPIEEQINGVEGMLYVSSSSTGDGRFAISVTFDLGVNLDTAQVQVQNRVGIAQPRLPVDVRNIGVIVAKSSPDLMMVVHLYSPDKSRDTLFISNFANLEIKDALTRVDGVGLLTVFGVRDYSMRIWLDPERLQSLNLTTGDVLLALQGQNIQVASGVLNQPPVGEPRRVPGPGPDGRTPHRSCRIFQHRREADRKRGRPAQGRGACGASSAGLLHDLLPRPRSGNRDGRIPAPGIECADHRRRCPPHHGSSRRPVSARHQAHHRLRSDAVHSRIGQRGDRDHPDRRRPRGAGCCDLPADLARCDHSNRRHSDFARRHLLLHDVVRLHAQQPVAVRFGARDWHRGR